VPRLVLPIGTAREISQHPGKGRCVAALSTSCPFARQSLDLFPSYPSAEPHLPRPFAVCSFWECKFPIAARGALPGKFKNSSCFSTAASGALSLMSQEPGCVASSGWRNRIKDPVTPVRRFFRLAQPGGPEEPGLRLDFTLPPTGSTFPLRAAHTSARCRINHHHPTRASVSRRGGLTREGIEGYFCFVSAARPRGKAAGRAETLSVPAML
jgi:hypothetical protein